MISQDQQNVKGVACTILHIVILGQVSSAHTMQVQVSTYLWVIPKLVVKPFPGAFIWIGNGDVISIW